MTEFFNMGGYGFYVWSAYGLALVVLVYNIVVPLRTEQRLLRELALQARLRKP